MPVETLVRPGLIVAVMLLVLADPRGAFGQAVITPPRVRFTAVRGVGAESCPDETSLAADISARLGRDPFDPHSERSVDLSLERTADAWVGRIYLRESP